MAVENLYATNCIRTYTGYYFDFVNPKPETICIEDIAHALSRQPRFGGHLQIDYSVAEHCIKAYYASPKQYAKYALLHDASEAYMCDIPRPLKMLLPDYKKIEERVMLVIARAFNLPDHFWNLATIKDIDNMLLEDEWNRYMINPKDYKRPYIRHDVEGVERLFKSLFRYGV